MTGQKKKLHREGVVHEVLELQGEIAGIPSEEYEGRPEVNRTLARLYRSYIQAVSDAVECVEPHSVEARKLGLTSAFIDAYIWPSRHLSLSDRAELVAMKPRLGILLLEGSHYEYRRCD